MQALPDFAARFAPLGAALCAVDAFTAAPRLRQFLTEGAHGDMDWLARNPERRGDPQKFWGEAR